VFENRVLQKICGPKRDEVKAEWRKVNNEELNDPNSSPNIVQVKKSRRMRLAAHVACIGERRYIYIYRVLVWQPEGRDHLGDPGVDGMMIFRWIFRKWDVGVWNGLSWLRIEIGGGYL
jgi:hypothetical protein